MGMQGGAYYYLFGSTGSTGSSAQHAVRRRPHPPPSFCTHACPIPQMAAQMKAMQEAMQRPEVQAQMAQMQAAMQNQQLRQRMEELKDDPDFADMWVAAWPCSVTCCTGVMPCQVVAACLGSWAYVGRCGSHHVHTAMSCQVVACMQGGPCMGGCRGRVRGTMTPGRTRQHP